MSLFLRELLAVLPLNAAPLGLSLGNRRTEVLLGTYLFLYKVMETVSILS